jgi:hypothetical protein
MQMLHTNPPDTNSLLHLCGVFLALLLSSVAIPSSAQNCSTAIAAGYEDFTYPSGTGGDSRPTSEKPESKLWFHDGSWWGSLWSSTGGAHHIHRLERSTQCWTDTGVTLDPRSDTKADVLFDGAKLYVVSHVYESSGGSASSGDRGELRRYSYSSGTWSADPGFPVEVNTSKGEALTIAKDSIGRLWVSFTESQEVRVNHSLCQPTCDDQSWGSPFAIPTANGSNLTSDDLSAVVAFDGKIGVLWSNQTRLEMYFGARTDTQPPASGWAEASAYSLSADDHMNVKTLDGDAAGRVFASIKTSGDDLIVFLVCDSGSCTASGDWHSYDVYDGGFSSTRPLLLLDPQNRDAYVAVRNKDSGEEQIFFKQANLDSPSFDVDDIGVQMIGTNQGDEINNPTSTKQSLSAASGMVVLAADDVPRRYLHADVSLGNALPACSDGADNDLDGLTDDEDPGCDDDADSSERGSGICDNGQNDDDDDLLADYPDDPGCRDAFWQFEAPQCQDGKDNDGDGRFDFDGGASANGGVPLGDPEPHCGDSWKNTEGGYRCGLGFEVALVLVLWRGLKRRLRA